MNCLNLFKRTRAIKPKSKPQGYYDYLQVERDNPNRPVDDFYVFSEGESTVSSLDVGVILYSIVGATVFWITRIVYDRDWDRYYHVNYPGFMEHFDKLVNHYDLKKENLLDELPGGMREVYDGTFGRFLKTLFEKNKVEYKIDFNVVQDKIADSLSESLGMIEEGDGVKKELAEKELD